MCGREKFNVKYFVVVYKYCGFSFGYYSAQSVRPLDCVHYVFDLGGLSI